MSEVAADTPYFGFYPSTMGREFKLFKHNILGFSIDIPASWTFGVFGKPPLTVALVYPEGLNTGIISENYEMIEIGQLPLLNINLQQAKDIVILGIHTRRKNIEYVGDLIPTYVYNTDTIRWKYSWRSKSGILLIEDISLIKFGDRIRSVTVRATKNKYDKQLGFYEPIASSFRPFDPTY